MEKEIVVAQYRGKSLISRFIKWQTRSIWSHSAIIFPVGDCYTLVEAWHVGGVESSTSHVLSECLRANHSPGTRVDLFSFLASEEQFKKMMAFALSQVGKSYDYSLLWKFVTRKKAQVDDKWICSELVAECFSKANQPLQNMPSWYFAPQHVGISTVLDNSPYLKPHI